ncbi:MAG: hypothetical protein IKW39_04865 [Alphaproteobacteria bacterium]|nr:hypothetical protein [Alphaproteobacteria bacterium]
MLFILLTVAIFILKFLAVSVVGLFFIEDLELTRSAPTAIYTFYFLCGATCFFSLLFFALGKKLFWLFLFLLNSIFYTAMYNHAPTIKNIHSSNNIKSRYFKDGQTFINRMKDVADIIDKKQK